MRSLLLRLVLLAAVPVQAQRVQLLVQSSPLAGFRYAEAAAVWPLLQLGDALELVREAGNPHDPNAVRVEWRGRKLGYVPRRDNAAVARHLDRGTALEARIAALRQNRNRTVRIELDIIAPLATR